MPNRDRILHTAAQHVAHSCRVFGSVFFEIAPGRRRFDLGGLLLDKEISALNEK
jgi:hypothetical protein